MARKRSTPIIIEPDAADKKALRAATRYNRRAMRLLTTELKKPNSPHLIDFARDNYDALDAYFKRAKRNQNANFAQSFDNALAALQSGKPEEQKAARDWIHKLVGDMLKHGGLSYSDLAKSKKLGELIDGKISRGKTAKDNTIAALKTSGKLVLSPLLPFHYAAKGGAELYAAIASALGFGKTTRIAFLAALTAGSAAAQAMPHDAAPYAPLFLASAGITAQVIDSCTTYDIQRMDRMTAAFMFGMEPKAGSKDYERDKLFYLVAMRGIKQGISPIIMRLVMDAETLNGRNVQGRIASGPAQTLTATKIEWAVKYYKESPAYQEAKARLATGKPYADRENDLAETTAFEGLAAAYKKDKNRVLNALASSNAGKLHVGYDLYTAFKLADTPVYAGDFFASHLKHSFPDASIAALEGKTLDDLIRVAGDYYTSHLPGPYGGPFLLHMSKVAPNTRLTDSEAIIKLYSNYPARISGFTTVGTFYPRMARDNASVFPHGPDSTVAQAVDGLRKKIAGHAADLKYRVSIQLASGGASSLLCFKDPITVMSVVPKKTTNLEIAALTGKLVWDRTAPDGLKSGVAYTLDMAANASQLAFNFASHAIAPAKVTFTTPVLNEGIKAKSPQDDPLGRFMRNNGIN